MFLILMTIVFLILFNENFVVLVTYQIHIHGLDKYLYIYINLYRHVKK